MLLLVSLVAMMVVMVTIGVPTRMALGRVTIPMTIVRPVDVNNIAKTYRIPQRGRVVRFDVVPKIDTRRLQSHAVFPQRVSTRRFLNHNSRQPSPSGSVDH